MNNVSFYFFVISIPFCFVNCFQLVAAKGRRREKKKSCFADLFLDGWRRPSGVSILDCTLSKRWVSFLFFFFIVLSKSLPAGKRRRRSFSFLLGSSLMCRVQTKRRKRCKGRSTLSNSTELQAMAAAKEGGGGGLDIYMYIYFLYVYPPTHLTDPQRTSKTLFVCVCVPVGKLEAISP